MDQTTHKEPSDIRRYRHRSCVSHFASKGGRCRHFLAASACRKSRPAQPLKCRRRAEKQRGMAGPTQSRRRASLPWLLSDPFQTRAEHHSPDRRIELHIREPESERIQLDRAGRARCCRGRALLEPRRTAAHARPRHGNRTLPARRGEAGSRAAQATESRPGEEGRMSATDGFVGSTLKLVDHGPDGSRWNLVIVGDGYRAGELAQSVLTFRRSSTECITRRHSMISGVGSTCTGSTWYRPTAAPTTRRCVAAGPAQRRIRISIRRSAVSGEPRVSTGCSQSTALWRSRWRSRASPMWTRCCASSIPASTAAPAVRWRPVRRTRSPPKSQSTRSAIQRSASRTSPRGWGYRPAGPSRLDQTSHSIPIVRRIVARSRGGRHAHALVLLWRLCGGMHAAGHTAASWCSGHLRRRYLCALRGLPATAELLYAGLRPILPGVRARVIRQVLAPFLQAESVNLLTPSISFADIPEGIGGTGVTTHRAIVFEVTTCRRLHFTITAGPTGGLGRRSAQPEKRALRGLIRPRARRASGYPTPPQTPGRAPAAQ